MKKEIEDLVWKIMVGSATGNIEPNEKEKFVDEFIKIYKKHSKGTYLVPPPKQEEKV